MKTASIAVINVILVMKIIPVKVQNKQASVPIYVDDWDYDILSCYLYDKEKKH